MPGTLYLCGLPIGNPDDITPATLRVLRDVDVIACEDTRTFALKYGKLKLNKPFTSYHDHSSDHKLLELVGLLEQNKNVALVSDAGMPLVSDPGYQLVKAAHEKGINVRCTPGPTALITALVLSGLPTDRFCFEGFLKQKESQRLKQLEELRTELRTMIFYESPYRVIATLENMLTTFGNRASFVVREMTKPYEEQIKGSISECLERLKKKQPKGEYVLVIHGAEKDPA
jgi:16S rRNA (cytidine1402-2'-O)-methyltransferase